LPLIKEISKSKECNLYIQCNKKIINNVDQKHPFGNFYLNEDAAKKIIPLLKEQKYLKKVSIYDKSLIDIDLDFFRDLGLNFNIDSVRWYFHLTAIHCDLTEPYVFVNNHKTINNKIVIFYAHKPVPTFQNNYETEYQTLIEICNYVKSNNMKFYKMSELYNLQNSI
jgi:hypothetical protein